MTDAQRSRAIHRRSGPWSSIVVRLLAAFVLVSFLPISVLAALSLAEASTEGLGQHQHEGAAGDAGHDESLAGVPIAMIELGVAGISLVVSVVAAVYIGRTIVRPVRALEASVNRVEAGDLDAMVDVGRRDEIGHLAAAFNRMVEGLRREALVRDLFGQYVSPEVARVAIERRGQLNGQVVESTVLFVDIRRFTALAEVLPPARLIGTLNRYFERMLVAVEAEGGIVNKFGGDSLLAIFGSPLNPQLDHAERAAQAAVRMRLALVDFNRDEAQAELPELRVGFGVATGQLVAGNVGSSRKVEYTVIGDPVNLAARLQELSGELGVEILISAETARMVGRRISLRSLGEITVRGRAAPVEVFTLDSFPAPGSALDAGIARPADGRRSGASPTD